MATTRDTRSRTQKKSPSFGLLANGSSGAWEVAIDESTAGPDCWFIHIEGPSLTLCFEIDAVRIVGKIIRSLEPHPESSRNGAAKRSSTLLLSKDTTLPVALVKDDEFADRFFIVVGRADCPTARLTVAGSDVAQLLEALRQTQSDLDA